VVASSRREHDGAGVVAGPMPVCAALTLDHQLDHGAGKITWNR
jgi:hypothetical protein